MRHDSETCCVLRSVAAVLALFAALSLGMQAPSARAQTAPLRGLGVQVINSTPGGSPVAGAPLTVLRVDGSQLEVAARGKVDTRGAASWPDLSGPVEGRYVVSTTFQGVIYRTEPAALPATGVSLFVYDSSSDDSAVRVSNSGLVVTDIDAPNQRVRVLETMTLRNSAQRTFLPQASGSRGPMGLLRFGLPANAINFVPDDQLATKAIIQVDKGFASDLPLLPGDTNLSFAYDVPYGATTESGRATLTKNVNYPIDTLRLLVLPGDFTVSSPQLLEKGTVQVGSRMYRQYQGDNLPGRSELTLVIEGLPLVWPVLRSANLWVRVMLGVLLVGGVALPLLYKRRYARNGSTEATEKLHPDLGGAIPAAVTPVRVRTTRPRRTVSVERPPRADKEGSGV